MPTRTLKFKLADLLASNDHCKNLSQEEIAERLGVVPNTVRKYLRNESLKFERRVIERACDWLNVGVEQLFELVDCDFFPPGDTLLRLRSKPDDPNDFTALGTVLAFFDRVRIEEDLSDDRAKLSCKVHERNCLIVGSPHHNAAGEIALCTLFGADPNDNSDSNRRKLPLTIEVPPEWQADSVLIQTAVPGKTPLPCRVLVPETGEKSKEMAFERKKAIFSADYYPPKLFQPMAINDAQDFGIILIADHWIGAQQAPVRTYWLSGFSSVGTMASIRAVQDDVRDFSLDTPRDKPGEFVLAIVKATFRKDAGSRNRILNDDYEIVHRIRGSLPHPVLPLRGNDQSHGTRENDDPQDELKHDRRRESLRRLISKTWSGPLDKSAPIVMNFYAQELRHMPDVALAELFGNVEQRYANVPKSRRPTKSIEQFLEEIKKTRDDASNRLF